MALNWVDFFWSWKRVSNRRSTPPSGSYTIAPDDTALDFTATGNTTWTLPAPNGSNAPKKIKHKGTGTTATAAIGAWDYMVPFNTGLVIVTTGNGLDATIIYE